LSKICTKFAERMIFAFVCLIFSSLFSNNFLALFVDCERNFQAKTNRNDLDNVGKMENFKVYRIFPNKASDLEALRKIWKNALELKVTAFLLLK